MEEYLYQKEYVMLNNMQLHLSNPEPMLKYIDENRLLSCLIYPPYLIYFS